MPAIHCSNILAELDLNLLLSDSHQSKSELLNPAVLVVGEFYDKISKDSFLYLGQFPVMNILHFYQTQRMTFCR